MRIGELGRQTGVTTRALRYYEQRGLLSASRQDNGYREYDSTAVVRVRNVRMLLAAGLSSEDIRQLGACLAEDLNGTPVCDAAVELYEKRLEAVQERIETLQDLRGRLRTQLGQLRPGAVA